MPFTVNPAPVIVPPVSVAGPATVPAVAKFAVPLDRSNVPLPSSGRLKFAVAPLPTLTALGRMTAVWPWKLAVPPETVSAPVGVIARCR